jgi:hypothetical protein
VVSSIAYICCDGGLVLAVMMVGTMLTCCFVYRIAFMVSFGFSLAGAVRDARGGYKCIEGGVHESGRLEAVKGRDFE